MYDLLFLSIDSLAFLYNPPTNTWSTLASNAVPRLYHSGAILLADGRVVSTGSEEQSYIDWVNQTPNCYNGGANAKFPACTSPFEMRMEVFEPPYLFLPVQRPVIVMGSVQATVKYATSFSITLATDASKIDAVSFVRYSTSTHSLNTDQRYVELVFTVVDAGTLKITSPTNSKIAPPGNWFLFVSREGKPSVAATVLLSL
jgi:galactose oxidase